MAILITGAAGVNGTAAVHEFARHGEPIRALVRNRAQARELVPYQARFARSTMRRSRSS